MEKTSSVPFPRKDAKVPLGKENLAERHFIFQIRETAGMQKLWQTV